MTRRNQLNGTNLRKKITRVFTFIPQQLQQFCIIRKAREKIQHMTHLKPCGGDKFCGDDFFGFDRLGFIALIKKTSTALPKACETFYTKSL
jgi:hypothetical protein